MSAIIPIPRVELSIRPATLADVPFMDGMQKKYARALGYFPTKQFEEYVQSGGVLIAQEGGRASGYCVSRDRYLKRDELGVIYQLCVQPGAQRKLVGAALVREVFARSAYGCRLYCCWCAQDLEANRFWESMGFLPIAFRAGSSGKGRRPQARVHIFWQRRIVEGDQTTPYWYPSQTNQGAIREDRLVFPIPPGVHWTDVEAVVLPTAGVPTAGVPNAGAGEISAAAAKQIEGPQSRARNRGLQVPTVMRRQFGAVTAKTLAAAATEAVAAQQAKAARATMSAPRPKVKNDPRHVAAARELRDRWLEHVNANPAALTAGAKYQVGRAIVGPTSIALPAALPASAAA